MTELRYNYSTDGTLISATVPRYVFKFAPVNSYSISSLREKYLWFSRPAEFNDIFELPTKVRQEFSDSELRSYFRANLPFHLKKFGVEPPDSGALEATITKLLTEHRTTISTLFQKSQQVRRDLIRICCLSMRYDDPLMWAHYAASFAGVCLVFDFPALVAAGPWFPVQVKYVDQTPVFDPVSTSLRHHAAPRPYQDNAANLEYDQIQFGAKLNAWAHEKELRLCTLQSEPKQHYPEEALLGVIMGPRISQQDEQSIVDAASHSRIPPTFGRLTVDENDSSLTVAGLQNTCVEMAVIGVRNLAKEIRRGGGGGRDVRPNQPIERTASRRSSAERWTL